MSRYCHIALSLLAIVLAAITVSAFGMADGLAIVAALSVAWALPYAVARRSSWWTSGASIALCAVSLIVAASAVYYMWHTTIGCGATLEMPKLDSDASKYYNWALHYYDGRCPEPRTTFFGFPIAMLLLWKVLGVSIVWPVAMNVSLTITSIAMGAALAASFVRGRDLIAPATAATLTIALLALHGYFLSQGYVVQKEALVYVSMTMVAMGLFRINDTHCNRRQAITGVALYTLACIILALVRAKYINFAAFGVALLAVARWRTCWRSIASLVAVTFATWLMGMYCSTTYTVAQQVGNVVGGEYITLSMGVDTGIQASYLGYMDGYFCLAAWKKVLLLPFTCGTQYIIPFPWGAESNDWTSVFPRVRLGWYLCGGLAMCYYAILSWRKGTHLGLVAWWPVVCAMGISYICAGTVSRYILPYQPMLTAIAVYVLAHIWTNRHRRPLATAYAAYAIILITALLIAWHISH